MRAESSDVAGEMTAFEAFTYALLIGGLLWLAYAAWLLVRTCQCGMGKEKCLCEAE